ncbi:MAG: ABC transporter permease [Cyanobacteria bacterium CRU_2_1]|nr:ABC transporter permease [Cyanobacteria bacterium CRU_2_1]
MKLTNHYVVRRILQLIPVLLGISIVTFLLIQLMPSDPAAVVLRVANTPATPEAIAAMREKLGLDRPLPVQYLDWLWHVLRLDFGQSFVTGKPVLQEVMHYVPTTLILTACATLLIFAIGLPMGIVAALYRDTVFDQISRLFAYIGVAMPSFWLGFLLIYVFSFKLGWFSVIHQGAIADWIFAFAHLSLGTCGSICSFIARQYAGKPGSKLCAVRQSERSIRTTGNCAICAEKCAFACRHGVWIKFRQSSFRCGDCGKCVCAARTGTLRCSIHSQSRLPRCAVLCLFNGCAICRRQSDR